MQGPVIDGNTVIWEDDRNGDYDIYGYDLSSGAEFPICIRPGDQIAPDVAGDTVVWWDYNNGDIVGAIIPEPATLSLLALGSMVILRRRRCGAIENPVKSGTVGMLNNP